MLRYTICAERWHWTPDQYDDQRVGVVDWMLKIAETMDQVQRDREEKASSGSNSRQY